MAFVNAIAYHLPNRKISNKEIIDNFIPYSRGQGIAISEKDLFAKTGISFRFESELSQTAKDLGISAALNLFQKTDYFPSQIEAVIFISDAIDYKGPSTACIIQSELNLPQSVMAFDVLQGCTGWVYGLSLAKGLIASHQVENVLVITADTPRRVIHPEDLELSALFSDGGAAAIVSSKPIENSLNFKICKLKFGTNGNGSKYLYTERSASKEPADIEWLSQYKEIASGLGGGRLRMNSDKIFLFALRIVPQLTKNILEQHDLSLDDIDLFVYHQANGVMLEFLRKRMKIPKEKFIISIENIGNTVSSSIPIVLSQLIEENKVKQGMCILIAGFGIGLSWGGTVLKVG